MLISTNSSFVDRLYQSLQEPLPGVEAQYRMAHVARQGSRQIPDYVRMAGVLALLYPKQNQWHIVLIERMSHAADRHSGQISFPGGRYDTKDPSLEATALREAQEEVGVDPQHVQLLGALTNLYIPVSNYLVHPFVGFTPDQPLFRPEEREVRSIIEVPFAKFIHPKTRKTKNLAINPQITLRDVPYFDIFGKTVWGATAMMLSELMEVVQRMQR